MKRDHYYLGASTLPGILFLLLTAAALGCTKEIRNQSGMMDNNNHGIGKPPQLLKDYNQVNLVSNSMAYHPMRLDSTLLNAWGIAFSPTGIAWVNANGAGLSEVFDKQGNDIRPPVNIPSPSSPTGGTPTGITFNGGSGFMLANGRPARFIFVTEDGIIAGWNGGNNAEVAVNNSSTAVYKGVTIAMSQGMPFLYAANFTGGKIDVFNMNWAPVTTMSFMDPMLPAGYAPFNVQAIGDSLYVLYAKRGEGIDEAAGPGNGYVDIYTAGGTLIRRLVSRGQLNAPWGIAMAPDGFFGDDNEGRHSVHNVVLVGNFGDGHINAYNSDGNYLGQLRSHGQPVVIDGLWGLKFPPASATSVDPNRLYFAAGPNDENDGLFGYLEK